MDIDKNKTINITGWTVALLTSVTSIAVWLQYSSGQIVLSGYRVFPLLGLLAFGLMWSHYIIGAVRRYCGVAKSELERFYSITGWIVLVLILMHPGLLIVQLWRDGFGLPPFSYLNNYVAASGKIFALLGSISLFVFLLFELRRKFKERKWWRWVEYAQLLAMIAIYFHALNLGGELTSEWFRIIWYIYGITLILATVYNYTYDRKYTVVSN